MNPPFIPIILPDRVFDPIIIRHPQAPLKARVSKPKPLNVLPKLMLRLLPSALMACPLHLEQASSSLRPLQGSEPSRDAPPLDVPSSVESQQVQSAVDQDSAYQRFLLEEASYVAEGTWDRFPQGSRLFVGRISR